MLTRASARKAWLSAILLPLLLFSPLSASPQTRKTQARAEFEKAEDLRLRLEAQPQVTRRPADYLAAIRGYQRALHLGPATTVAPESLAAAARMWSEMAAAFGGRQYAANAAERYRFLIKEYPKSKLVAEARDKLPALESAPPSAFRAEKQDAGKAREKAVRSASSESPATGKAVLEAPVPPPDQREPGRIAQVTSIRHWATPNYTRVVIELDAPVEYQAGRITNPDRIFFDLHGAHISAALRHQTISGDDNLLKRVRMAQNQSGIARIVLEVGQIRDYSAFLLPNPYRLVVDINGTRAEPAAERKEAGSESKARSEVAGRDAQPNRPAQKAGDTKLPQREVAEAGRAQPNRPPNNYAGAVVEKTQRTGPGVKSTDPRSAEQIEPAAERIDIASVASASPVGSQPVYERVAPPAEKRAAAKTPAAKGSSKPEAAGNFPADARTGQVARPTSKGDRSLTRALGLKIGTFVIDAGHGGHDTGTIGPSGLTEKELVLDVAQRLGAIIEERLGGEVVYTRSDDTFVPLETRTAIANQKQADLFVSIHANSSRDSSARGIETYYLNFTSAQDALAVAARENAVSEKSIHELQDLVKKITLSEKVEESREFASEVQGSLYTTMSRGNTGLRNRGVKKAPFVVLIGANMPSILAEISFVSNPTDEKLLRKSDYRQKVAEALYRGVQRYANSLSGVKVAAHRTVPNP